MNILLGIAFFATLFALSVVDLKEKRIPNFFHLIILGLAVVSFVVRIPDLEIWARLLGFIVVSIPMLLLSMVVKGAFGGGDIKLMAVAGLLLGFKGILIASIIGVVTSAIFASAILIAKKISTKDHFAFGPFLSIGLAVSYSLLAIV